MTRKKRAESAERIKQVSRRRKIAVLGLVLGVALIAVGQLLYLPALFILGYTVFIICTGIASFLTAFKWLYARGEKAELSSRASPVDLCPRCGSEVKRDGKYCRKCGKRILRKAR